MKDTGILNKVMHDAMKAPIPIPYPRVRHNQPLTFGQLGITMIILAAGLFIAFMVFVGEFCTKRRARSDPEQKEQRTVGVVREQGHQEIIFPGGTL